MKRLLFFAIVVLMFTGCNNSGKDVSYKITVKNPVNINRQHQTVEVSLTSLGIDSSVINKYGITDDKGNVLVYQHYASDHNGKTDAILFQTDLKANEAKTFILKQLENQPEFSSKVYSRFVPERTDDYAWENDKVGFRTFGPDAQQRYEKGDPTGTLSSGIDCWLKRVDYPIINKWYEKATTGKGTYHKDTGEGFDDYHVGASRGCGGTGVWSDDTLWVSKNFTSWKRTANGPIRTEFILEYADWNANGKLVKEQKTISLDVGSNLSKIKVDVKGVDTLTAGITLHENAGKVITEPDEGWFTYIEPHKEKDYTIGTAIVLNPENLAGFRTYISPVPDHSQLFVDMKVNNGEVVYYSGFYWSKSGQFKDENAWEKYLQNFSVEIQNPVIINIERMK